jgi:DNA invertase Pin-like site-specific DNA recombinase
VPPEYFLSSPFEEGHQENLPRVLLENSQAGRRDDGVERNRSGFDPVREREAELKTVGIYARVSTLDQHPENQVIELRRYATARGWNIYEDTVFTDKGISGAKGVESRPQLKLVMDLALRRKINVFLVWEFSRFARSTQQLIEALTTFRDCGVDFVSVQQNVDTTTATGRLVYGFIALIAEYERELIRERTLLGLRRAVAEGKTLGRPRLRIDHPMESLDDLAARLSVRKLALALKISDSSAARLKRRLGGVPKTPAENEQIPAGKAS